MQNILSIKDLSVSYKTSRGKLQALRNIDIDINKGEIIGLVGESGCGKSTLISSIINLLASNSEIVKGQVNFKQQNLQDLTNQQMRDIRGQQMSMIFQDPMTTLNPVLSIGQQMLDIQYRSKLKRKEKLLLATQMLAKVGIPDPASRLKAFPHQFSGGMCQRIAIAMALMMEPDLLIADEPTTALDATLEVQIIQRLRELQQAQGCSILFISHHLGVIAELCDRVVVMYAGEVVEQGSVRDIFQRPKHPYTQKLLECDPAVIAEKTRHLPTIKGSVPDLTELPQGCIFADRCQQVQTKCSQTAPKLKAIDVQGADPALQSAHQVSCHLVCEDVA
jgi:oligopeptide/dipeptide ABC transporter ATP-binding protein